MLPVDIALHIRSGYEIAGTGYGSNRIVGKADLHGVDGHALTQIDAEPFFRFRACRSPPGLNVFIHRVFGRVSRIAGRSRHVFSKAQQHPVRLRPWITAQLVSVHRPVPVALIAEQLAVIVKPGGSETDAPLEDVVDRNTHGGRVPPCPLPILQRGAVAGAGEKAARLVGIGVVVRE